MYEVIKEYCGVKVGTKVNSSDSFTIRHMLKEGYWKLATIEKLEPTIKKRKKKVIENAPKNK